MVPRDFTRHSVKLPALLLLATAIPLAALAWLAWALLERDRFLEVRSQTDRLTNAAGLVGQELDRALSGWESELRRAADNESPGIPSTAALLIFDRSGVISTSGARLVFVPRVPLAAALPPAVFAAAEVRELRDHKPGEAADMYRQLSRSSNARIRAEALVRLARCLRAERRLTEAADVYAGLETFEGVNIAGVPAPLVARRERAALFEELGQVAARDEEVSELRILTESGRFRIDRATFDFLARPAPTIEALALSEAAEALWPTWLEQRSGRAAAHVGEHEFVSVWSPTPTGSVAVIGRLDGITGQAAAVAKTHAVNVALVDESGRVRSTWGAPIDDTGVTKGQRETNLPWVLRVSFADPESTNALLISRQRVMIGVFALMALMTAASTGLVFRAVRREVAVAQLQSDFLAAVSHEFRTPLAAMSHLTETLSEKRATPERVPEYYDALARETRRLHGLVESLLDFGRTEAGRRVYQRTEIDVSQIVLDVVNSTRNIATLPPDRIAVDIPGPPCRTFADRDAMALVVRNLLDNALKYSPPTSIVRIAVRSQGRHIAVVVEDAGAGISKSEQRLVFRKFVRGAAAADLDVKGTGIGLTMARHVVLAHGGRLTLASEAGRGSRFTVWLPALPVLRVESAIADHP